MENRRDTWEEPTVNLRERPAEPPLPWHLVHLAIVGLAVTLMVLGMVLYRAVVK